MDGRGWIITFHTYARFVKVTFFVLKLETENFELTLKAGCPHPAKPTTRTPIPYAGGVAAGSPGLARPRLPGVLRVKEHAPRRRCEDPRSLLQPLQRW